MVCDRDKRIAASFGGQSASYERHAHLQKDIARILTDRLPPCGPQANILEIGCGTGFLTAHLLARYPDAAFVISDLSESMVTFCSDKFPAQPNCRFEVMDGQRPAHDHRFDLIVSSMALQWFHNPAEALERQRALLKPGGRICYAALGPDSFPEWRQSLQATGAPSGLLQPTSLPGQIENRSMETRYNSAAAFLRFFKQTGAQQPRDHYRPMSAAKLRQVCRYYDQNFDGIMRWHIQFGQLEA